jgi:hypothetical protein
MDAATTAPAINCTCKKETELFIHFVKEGVKPMGAYRYERINADDVANTLASAIAVSALETRLPTLQERPSKKGGQEQRDLPFANSRLYRGVPAASCTLGKKRPLT